MDVVYVFKEGNNKSIELRYSLMFLNNIPHDNVFIVGDKPDRIKNIIHIPAEDKYDKLTNVINKYHIICDDKRISEDFLLMNDDMYIIKQTTPKIYVKGTLKDHLKYIDKMYGKTTYYKIVEKVYNQFPDGMSYNTHTPMIYNKNKLKTLLVGLNGELTSIRSLYGNSYHIEAEKLNNGTISDCKFYTHKDINITEDMIYVSSDDGLAYSDYLRSKLNKILESMPNSLKYKYVSRNYNGYGMSI